MSNKEKRPLIKDLKLTVIIIKEDNTDVYTGFFKEIKGITVQCESICGILNELSKLLRIITEINQKENKEDKYFNNWKVF